MVAHVPIVPRRDGKGRPTGEEPLVDGCGGPSLGLHPPSSTQDRPAGGGRPSAELSSVRRRGVLRAPTSDRTPGGHKRLLQELTAAQERDLSAPPGALVSPSPRQTRSHRQKYCHQSHPESPKHLPATPNPVPSAQHAQPGLPSRPTPLQGRLCAGAAYYPPPAPPGHQPLLVPAPRQCSCVSAVQSVEVASSGPLIFQNDKYRKGPTYIRWQEPGQNRAVAPYSPPYDAIRLDRQPALWTRGIMELSAVSGAAQRMAGEEEAGGSDARESGSGEGDTRSMERGSTRGDKEPHTERSLQKGEIQHASQRTERKRSAEEAGGQVPEEPSRPRKRKRSPSCASPIPGSPSAKRRSEDGSEENTDPAEMTQGEVVKADRPDQSPRTSLSSGEEADIDSSDSDTQRRISHMQRFAGTMTGGESEPARAECPAPSDDGGKEVPPSLPLPSWAHGDQHQGLGSNDDDTLVSNKIVSLWSASPEIMDQIAGEENPQEQHKPKP